ncbi:hypothetical protein LINPERPRIM_LOCUS23797 [Linum perenne]
MMIKPFLTISMFLLLLATEFGSSHSRQFPPPPPPSSISHVQTSKTTSLKAKNDQQVKGVGVGVEVGASKRRIPPSRANPTGNKLKP